MMRATGNICATDAAAGCQALKFNQGKNSKSQKGNESTGLRHGLNSLLRKSFLLFRRKGNIT